MAPEAQEHGRPCSRSTGDDMVAAEGERSQLAGEVGGGTLTDDESDHRQEHQERAVE